LYSEKEGDRFRLEKVIFIQLRFHWMSVNQYELSGNLMGYSANNGQHIFYKGLDAHVHYLTLSQDGVLLDNEDISNVLPGLLGCCCND
jgi:hypothetical protein